MRREGPGLLLGHGRRDEPDGFSTEIDRRLTNPSPHPMDTLTFGRLRNFSTVDRWLLLLSLTAGAAYLATRSLQPFPGSVVLKALSMAPLAVLACRVLHDRHHPDIEPPGGGG